MKKGYLFVVGHKLGEKTKHVDRPFFLIHVNTF